MKKIKLALKISGRLPGEGRELDIQVIEKSGLAQLQHIRPQFTSKSVDICLRCFCLRTGGDDNKYQSIKVRRKHINKYHLS